MTRTIRTALLLLTVSCNSSSNDALRVGPHSFSSDDLDTRRKLILLRHSGSERAEVGAYSQLIEGYLLAEVLSAMGRSITDQDLAEEISRINRDTQDAEGLKELKRICGGETASYYRRIALLPDFANRKFFFDVYPGDEKLHQDMLLRAKKALSQLRSGMQEETAGEQRVLLFSAKNGFEPIDRGGLPDKPLSPSGNTSVWAQFEEELFGPVPCGEWIDRVIALPEGFALMRWTGWEREANGLRKIEQRWFPKVDASEFFWARAGKIPVWIGDSEIRSEFRRTVSWASRVLWKE